MSVTHPMPALVRLYPSRLVRPYDGDTSYFALNLGFGVEIAGTDGKGVRCRYAGLNDALIVSGNAQPYPLKMQLATP
jgi:hypothetical protein